MAQPLQETLYLADLVNVDSTS